MQTGNSSDTVSTPAGVDKYDFEMQSFSADAASSGSGHFLFNLKYAAAGVWFGILLVKSEVISWFRIQEMFRLQSFHLYGVLGSAVITGIMCIWLIKKFNIKTLNGDTIVFPEKKFNKGLVYGGLIFGSGWAFTGACPGPLFAQIGTGATVVTATLLSAIAGTWVYGLLANKLPH
jgi:uncharacterized membrane protein YedE/YeeE